jgi:hypothetical protein
MLKHLAQSIHDRIIVGICIDAELESKLPLGHIVKIERLV